MEEVVIVVHDDEIRATLAEICERLGLRSLSYRNGPHAETVLRSLNPSLVIAEFSGTTVDGVALARSLRATKVFPIILVSRSLDEVEAVIAAQNGADRALAWPCSKALVSVSISSSIARFQQTARLLGNRSEVLRVGELCVDPQQMTVTWRGRDVRLTVSEFHLLMKLVQRPGAVLSRQQLMGLETSLDSSDRCVDSHIKRIRMKMRRVDPGYQNIEALYGVGYRYIETVEPKRVPLLPPASASLWVN